MKNRTPQPGRKLENQKKRQRRTRRRVLLCTLIFICLILLVREFYRSHSDHLAETIRDFLRPHSPKSPVLSDILPENAWNSSENSQYLLETSKEMSDKLAELLEHNEETHEFVTEYPNREKYLEEAIDLSKDQEIKDALDAGRVPLLMQWDTRWGYAPYGDDMLGFSGCGPTCLSMAYIYLTQKTSMNPAAMAVFAEKHGFYTESGTDWALWTDGVKLLGLTGEVLSLAESSMKATLDDGGVIICSMRPGDFTTTGHFILIRGYDRNGFFVNDPNRRSNSERQWTFDELSHQIKNLWGIW